MHRLIIVMTFFIATCAINAGCARESEAMTGRPLPTELSAAFANASKFELVSLEAGPGNHQGDDAYLGWRKLGSVPISDGPTQARLAGELDAAARAATPGIAAACFTPRHAIQVESDGAEYIALICFECLQIKWYQDGDLMGNISTADVPSDSFDAVLVGAGVAISP